MADPTFDRCIQLVRRDDAVIVRLTPWAGQIDAHVREFTLPPFPLSQASWLTNLASKFYHEHGRCLAAALVLDVVSRRWCRPELPTQRNAADGVSWAWRPEDFADRCLSLRVGGSFQTAVSVNLGEATARVPNADGLHLIHIFADDERHLAYAFLRVDGAVHLVPPDELLADDWQTCIEGHSERFRLI